MTPTTVDRAEVRRLVDEANAQLAEVLPRDEYDAEHLPGALHLPFEQLHADSLGASIGPDP